MGNRKSKKLSNSKVLLINLTVGITELAKNLILSGVNVYLYDKNQNKNDRLIDEKDINTNFFLNSSDLNKKRIKIITEKLSELNNYILVREAENLEKIESYSSVIQGFVDFTDLSLYEDICHKKGVPFFSLISSGLSGYFYTNTWKETKMKEKLIKSLVLSKQIDYFFSFFESNRNKRKYLDKNILFTCFAYMELYYRKHNGNEFKTLFLYVKDKSSNQGIEKIMENKEFISYLNKIIKNFRRDFNPVCSALAGILSQEIIKLITKSEEVQNGFYVYDAEKQSGLFFNPLKLE